MIVIHLCKCVIPFFKKYKFAQYFDNVQKFAGRELHNGERLLTLYEKIAGLNSDLISLNETHWRILDMQENSRTFEFKNWESSWPILR